LTLYIEIKRIISPCTFLRNSQSDVVRLFLIVEVLAYIFLIPSSN